MTDIQTIAADDFNHFNVPVKVLNDEILVQFDEFQFTFYKNTKLFNIGNGLMRYKDCKKETLLESKWKFKFLSGITELLNNMNLIIWIADDQMYVIADCFGNVLMSVVNENESVARDWQIH